MEFYKEGIDFAHGALLARIRTIGGCKSDKTNESSCLGKQDLQKAEDKQDNGPLTDHRQHLRPFLDYHLFPATNPFKF